MRVITQVFKRHIGCVRRYPATIAVLAVCCAIVLIVGWQNHVPLHAIGYLSAVWLCCAITDFVVLARPVHAIGFPVKHPPRHELATIVTCTLLGLVFLLLRYFTDWQHLPGLAKLAAMPLALCMFQVVTAVIYLVRYRYSPRQLGVNLHYWYLPLVLHIVWGGVTLLVAPAGSHWHAALVQYGLAGFLFTGLISAALPEEFLRMLLQTRIGKLVSSPPMGIVLASAIWAALHIPVSYSQDHAPLTLWHVTQQVALMMPVGIFWGYITHRTRSLLPGVMMHGFNLWGLQNF